MKWLKFLAFCLAVCSIICCKKNDDGDNNPGNGNGNCKMSWTVNGANDEATLSLCVYLDGTLNLSESASALSNTLQINPISNIGTFTTADGSVYILLILSDGTQIGPLDATINVTEFSNSKAKGTFSGTFYDIMDLNQSPDYTVTNGSFESDL